MSCGYTDLCAFYCLRVNVPVRIWGAFFWLPSHFQSPSISWHSFEEIASPAYVTSCVPLFFISLSRASSGEYQGRLTTAKYVTRTVQELYVPSPYDLMVLPRPISNWIFVWWHNFCAFVLWSPLPPTPKHLLQSKFGISFHSLCTFLISGCPDDTYSQHASRTFSIRYIVWLR